MIKVMSPPNISDFYDQLYSSDDKAFNGPPLPLIERLLEYIKTGTVLDFGAGVGRNSVYLATKGFQVTAVDISPTGVSKIKEYSEKNNLNIKTVMADIAKFNFTESYDVIICMFVLHHLNKEKAFQVIKNMRNHTKPAGYNIITSFTEDGDFFRNNPETTHFYLKNKTELAALYADWKTIRLFDKSGQARTPTDGEKLSNVFAGIIARKI